MTDVTRERELLAAYEVELQEAVGRAEQAHREVESLRPIVASLQRRIELLAPDEAEAARNAALDELFPDGEQPKKPLMADVILDFVRTRSKATTTEIFEHVSQQPGFESSSRNSVTNRLGKLVHEEKLYRRGPGQFALTSADELPSSDGDEDDS